MARSIKLAGHLSADELKARYRRAGNPVERSHLHVIWLLACGSTQAAAAAATGYSTRQVRIINRRYNEGGPGSLGDRRHHNAGARPRLDPDGQAELTLALAQPPADGGVWTGRKVAAWIAQRTGQATVPVQLGWVYLKRAGRASRQPLRGQGGG